MKSKKTGRKRTRLTGARLSVARQRFLVAVASTEKTTVRVLADFAATTVVDRALVYILKKK